MRRTVFLCLVTAFVLGMFAIPGPLSAADTIELKLAHFMPTMHVQHRVAFVPFAEKVAELTDGKVTVKIYPSAQLGNPKTMVDSIRNGITDIGFVLPSYVPGRFPRSSVFELPFIFNNAVNVTKVVYDIYDEYLAPDYKNFKVLWFLSAPLSQVQTVKKPILTAADFKGMKIRTGNQIESTGMKMLGSNPVSMPISELSISLQKGVVDGAATPYAAMKSFKLFDVVKYVSELNYSGALMVVLMNKKKWDSLPDFAKKAIDQAATRDFGLLAAEAYNREDAEMVAHGKSVGIQFHSFSDAEKAKIREQLKGIWDKWLKKNSGKFPARAVLDATLASAKANP